MEQITTPKLICDRMESHVLVANVLGVWSEVGQLHEPLPHAPKAAEHWARIDW